MNEKIFEDQETIQIAKQKNNAKYFAVFFSPP